MNKLPKTLEELDMLPQYCIEIDCTGAAAKGHEHRLPWVCYGIIVTEGNTLEELLDNATISLIDQYGGEQDVVAVTETWMIKLLVAKWDNLQPKVSNH